jgi:dUTP pyrophosphatase
MEINVRIKILRENAAIPAYQTPGSACCDLTAALDGPLTVLPGERVLVPTGIALDFGSAEYAALIFARSGLASKRGLALSNGVGVVDSDYRGEIKAALVNLSSEPQVIAPGERIAQLGFFPVARAVFETAAELDETERGAGGFGHTGV